MWRTPAFFGFYIVFLGFGLSGCGGETRSEGKVMVAFDKSALSVSELAGLGFEPDHFNHSAKVVGFVSEAAFFNTDAKEHMDVLDQDLWAVGGYDPSTLREREPFVSVGSRYEGYHDYEALTNELIRLADAYPELIRLQTAGKSVRGRELWYVVMSDNVQADEHEPKFIYHANMHGDEVVGRELMIYLIRHMAAEYGRDARITEILANSELFVMPSMNPDGFEMGRRANANGYDLNRNFPDRFTSTSDTPNGRQIEVQHMMTLAAENHFVYGINWHGGEICFNLPWGNIRNDRPANKYWDDAMFYPIGREYTEANRPMYANHHANFDRGLTYGYEWYPVNGGINDWYNWFRGSVHSVVELTVTKWPNSSTLPRHWEDNKEAMLQYLWRGLMGVHLRVVNSSGEVLEGVEVKVASAEGRILRFPSGYVHRLTAVGDQTVTVSVDGYAPKTLSVAARNFDGSFVDVVLEQ